MNTLGPAIGAWYKDLQTGASFEVVAVDPASQTIETQHIDGEVSEYDMDSWGELLLVSIEAPEDWRNPFELDADEFADPDLPRNSRPITRAAALAGEGRNDCEAVVRKRFPAMAAILEKLGRWGVPRVTGTGSGIYLAMHSEEEAISAAHEMKSLYNVRAVSGVDRSPLHDRLDACRN